MPSVFGKENKKKELIKKLGTIYEKIQREHQISAGDFPELKRMQVGSCLSVCLSDIMLVMTWPVTILKGLCGKENLEDMKRNSIRMLICS